MVGTRNLYKKICNNRASIEYNSSDEELVSHIKQKNRNSDEIELFLKTEQATALSNILNWWKVSFFNLKYLDF